VITQLVFGAKESPFPQLVPDANAKSPLTVTVANINRCSFEDSALTCEGNEAALATDSLGIDRCRNSAIARNRICLF
jgi:hypothetical protein